MVHMLIKFLDPFMFIKRFLSVNGFSLSLNMDICVLDVICLFVYLFELMDLDQDDSSMRTMCEPKLSLSTFLLQ